MGLCAGSVEPQYPRNPCWGAMCARGGYAHETGVQFFRIRTRVQQVVVRHMWALPHLVFETCCLNGSPGHSQWSHPGKKGRM